MDHNALINAKTAIDTLLEAGLISERQAANQARKLRALINDAITYWGEKGQDDIIDALNNAYRKI